MTKFVFVSLVSQYQNLGDFVIRKNAIDVVCNNRPVIALATRMPKYYTDSFALPEGSRIVRSSVVFQCLLLLYAALGRASILIAPGPVTLVSSPNRVLKSLVVLLDSMLVRLTGGGVYAVGRSYRGKSLLAKSIERLQSRFSNVYSVRDEASLVIVGERAQRQPDMAFVNSWDGDDWPRDRVVISVRSVTAESRALLVNVVQFVKSRGMDVVLVPQVSYDEAIHEELGALMPAEVLPWDESDYLGQLAKVECVYKSASIVISNRLHALIFGARFGAIPVVIDSDAHSKISATLDGVMPFYSLEHFAANPEEFLLALDDYRRIARTSWQAGQAQLIDFIKCDK